MLADFFTKPLQGSLFRRLRDVVLGYAHISTLTTPSAVVEERVGSQFWQLDPTQDRPIAIHPTKDGPQPATCKSILRMSPRRASTTRASYASVVARGAATNEE